MADASDWTAPTGGSAPGWDGPGGGGPGAAVPPGAGGPGWGGGPAGAWAPPTWGPGAPAIREPRPGTVPIRPLGVGELLDGAFTTCRRYARPVYLLSSVVLSVGYLAGLATQAASGGFASFDLSITPGTTLSTGSIAAIGLGALGSTLISAWASMVLVGVLAPLVGDAVLGRTVTAGGVWRVVRPRVAVLLVAAALAGVLPFLGLVALIVGGVFLWGVVGLAPAAVTLEGLGPWRAVRRAVSLATPDFFRVLGIRLLGYIIASTVSSVATLPFVVGGLIAAAGSGADPQGLGGVVLVVTLAVGFLATLLVEPFLAVLLVLLYLDRRMRAEALDLTLLDVLAAGPGPTGAPPG